MASFFKSPLGFWVGLCNHRAWFSPPETHATKEPLALAYSQVGPIALTQVMGQEFAIPKVLPITQVARMLAQVAAQLLPCLLVQASGPAFPLAFAQAGKAPFLKPMHPAFNGRGVFAKPVRHVVAAMTLADKQHAVKPVIVTGFIGSADFLLQRDSHRFRIGKLKSFHTGTLGDSGGLNQAHYAALLMTLCLTRQ